LTESSILNQNFDFDSPKIFPTLIKECDDDPIYCNDLSDTSDDYQITCTDTNNKTVELDVGSQCNLECFGENIQTGGETTVICSYSGDWKGDLGTCAKPPKDDCPPLPDIDNGVIYCRFL